MAKIFLVTVTSLLMSTLLVACGGAPSESDVKEGVYSSMKDLVGEKGAKQQKSAVDSIKLIGCKAASSGNGYVCDWTSEMGAGSGRLVKSDSGWKLVGQ